MRREFAEGAPGYRAGRMWDRVARTLGNAGVPAVEGGHVLDSLEIALAHRVSRLDDPHDTRLLHPARTLLILLDDARCRDPGMLLGAALLDSRFPELEVPPSMVRNLPAAESSATAALLERIPRPDWSPPAAGAAPPDGRFLEGLLDLPPGALELALSEALDHLRHLHLEREGALLPRGIVLTRAAYLPLARRAGGVLARRYEWWERTFSRVATEPGDSQV